MSTKPNTTLRLHHFDSLFSDCETQKDFDEAYEWAKWTENCLYDDITADIKDAMEQNDHFLTPEIRELQRIRDRIAKNISRLITTKERILQEQKNEKQRHRKGIRGA